MRGAVTRLVAEAQAALGGEADVEGDGLPEAAARERSRETRRMPDGAPVAESGSGGRHPIHGRIPAYRLEPLVDDLIEAGDTGSETPEAGHRGRGLVVVHLRATPS